MLKTAFCTWPAWLRHRYMPTDRTANTAGRNRGEKLLAKTLLVMRLTVLLLTAGFLNVCAKGVSQNISFSGKNVTLESVFASLEKQTPFVFLYTEPVLRSSKPVSISVEDVPLQNFLDDLFDMQPHLKYSIRGRNIFIVPKLSLSPHLNDEQLAKIPIRGRVVEDNGQPLAGASVTVKGSGNTEVTDGEGVFTCEVSEGDIITVTYVGHQTRQIKITSKILSAHELAITLAKASTELDEMVIIAYGTTTKRFNTGNVGSVKSEEIEKQPVNNPLLALQGRVPGLVISQATGYSGSGVTINIQGQNSIGKGNMPFYVVDGVPYTSEMLPNFGEILGATQSGNGGNYGTPTSGNPLSYLNPQDIESIDVLKDADATAIYGSRAANGAILITTKRGKAGKTAVDFNVQKGFGQVSRRMKLLNTQQYLEIRKEAYANDGLPVPTTGTSAVTADLVYYDPNRYTDWQDVLIGKSAQYNDAQMNVSGGNNQFQYLVGANYHKETTVLPIEDRGDDRASIHFNLNSSSVDSKFKFSLSGNYMLSKRVLPITDLTDRALALAPNAPELFMPDGSLNWALMSNGFSSWLGSHPLVKREEKYKDRTANLISNANISYEIVKGLTLRTSLGYTNMQTDEFRGMTSKAFQPAFRPLIELSAQYGVNNINSWIVEPQLNYVNLSRFGRFDFLAGTTFQQTNANRKQVEGRGYSNDLQLENLNAALTVTIPYNSAVINEYKYHAIFGRLNYNLLDRYVINFSARRDGTSRFGRENRFHNFGAIGAAWLFYNEPWLKDVFSFLSFGKLKGSYGTTGSDQIGEYQYLSLYNSTSYMAPYGGGSGLTASGLPNPYLQWEEVKKLSASLELGFIKDRILITGTYFRNRSSNQLLFEGLVPSTGFYFITTNMPATVQNSGLELSLMTENIQKKNFRWSSTFNISVPRNKLLSNYNVPGYEPGQPITFTRVFNYSHVDQETGLYQFIDKDGKLITHPTDAYINQNTAQTLYGGFQNSVVFHNFMLDVFIQFARQNGQAFSSIDAPAYLNLNAPVEVYNRWQKPGDVARTQKFTTSNFDLVLNHFAYIGSNALWTDASYIKLKNVSLSYNFPTSALKKIRLQKLRLFVHGQNLLTITDFLGLDPEARNTRSLPPLRVLTSGIQITI